MPEPRALPPRTLVEHGDIPLAEIAALAIREGRRPRAIYTAHKWFARRLGTVFRSLLIGAVCDPDADFWQAYYGGAANLRGLTVLDPFVGGGTSIVEAGRLGASTLAVDIDPIACSITNLEVAAAQLPDLADALAALQATVGQALSQYHTFAAPDGTRYKVLHHFWVQVVACAACQADFEAHPNFQLAYDSRRQWAFCSDCGAIETRPAQDQAFDCGACGKRTQIMAGRVDFGKATCPGCGHAEPLIEHGRRTGTPPRWREFAVEVLARPDGGRIVPMEQRLFFAAGGSADFRAAELALQAQRAANPAAIPDLGISRIDRFDSRLIDYGYRRWADLFNPRQLLHLALLAEAIQGYPDPIRAALSMAFSDHLTTNCMLTSYAAGWRRLTPLFSIRAFRHIPRPVELNPWADKSGRGSFPNAVRKLMRAAAYARAPKEPIIDGGFKAVPAVAAERAPRISCGSARDLSFIPSDSVDLVLTDPPYFDNIAYSELAEFFLPWLQHLKIVSPQSGVEQVLLESLVGRRNDAETIQRYQAGLTDAFGEVARVLKPDGLMMFSYRHSRPEAWLALTRAIAPHPLAAIRVLPAPGEAGAGLHAHEGTGFWDAVFILRKRPQDLGAAGRELRLSDAEIAAAGDLVAEWSARLETSALAFTAADRATLRRAALAAATLGPAQPHAAGAAIPLAQALSTAI